MNIQYITPAAISQPQIPAGGTKIPGGGRTRRRIFPVEIHYTALHFYPCKSEKILVYCSGMSVEKAFRGHHQKENSLEVLINAEKS